ncbi:MULTISPECIES: galactokinase [unclassified Fusibacter]|uniref:galactokinase n=1 Tax=unclassified Fusibacter TaxID=2624464 RepID=UPI001010FF98|nr:MULTISPECIES: galactokinase [unclassified Fusibacter]MCK8060073.1 galactokinase [Fusibacter sp. A2]NPE22215.1 galactokinase [Fusibacter sp. A1]RXV60990.1 galactokinase [Fusibacter sp. A1]
MIKKLIDVYKKTYETSENPRIFFSPGRVNLIGEYTDISGGHVLPCALKIGTYVAAQKRDDQLINLYSINIDERGVESVTLSDSYDLSGSWTDYPKGVLQIFADEGHMPSSGLNLCFYGNIPNSSGLSSSASLELAMSVVLNSLFEFGLSPVEMVKYSQRAENNFVGVQCGIMDQFIIGMGRENHAILLDTSTLDFQYAPVELGDYALVVTNSNKKRGLADSKYNERVAQCKSALEAVNTIRVTESLGSLSADEFERVAHAIVDRVELKRARHAVYENQRTLKAAKALEEGRLVDFGLLMNESHRSLKEDFEVTGHELDTLVELSQAFDGVIGSRMTGAGFGGCTVTLIKKDKIKQFIDEIGTAYESAVGYKADFYPVAIGDGAKEICIGE